MNNLYSFVCMLIVLTVAYGRNLGVSVKTNATAAGLPSAHKDPAFAQKVAELKKQALKLMVLRGKKVDPKVDVSAGGNWDDMQLTKNLYESIKKSFDEEEKRLTSKNETDRMTAPDFNLIPYAKWSMPIKYTTSLVQDEAKLELLQEAIQQIESNTCIKFSHVNSAEGPHIEYKEVSDLAPACADSPLGMQPDKNTININFDCTIGGTYIHETLHSLGFAHTQMRPDFDQYITIDETNIVSQYMSNFKPWAYALTDQGPYDFGSIMHYNRFAFAIDQSRPTLEPKQDVEENRELMGQRERLSDEDVRLLNKLYCEDADPDKNADCIDKSTGCAEFESRGNCKEDSEYYAFMQNTCRYSCKFCSSE